jgi:hypothetical protein
MLPGSFIYNSNELKKDTITIRENGHVYSFEYYTTPEICYIIHILMCLVDVRSGYTILRRVLSKDMTLPCGQTGDNPFTFVIFVYQK